MKNEARPFHETIIAAIKAINSDSDIKILADLIVGTKIPASANHDWIAEAWELNAGNERPDVLRHIRSQKKAVEKEAQKNASFNGKMRQIQQAIEKVISLNPRGWPGIMGKGSRVKKPMRALHEIMSQLCK